MDEMEQRMLAAEQAITDVRVKNATSDEKVNHLTSAVEELRDAVEALTKVMNERTAESKVARRLMSGLTALGAAVLTWIADHYYFGQK